MENSKNNRTPIVSAGCPFSGWEVALPAVNRLAAENADEHYATWLDKTIGENKSDNLIPFDHRPHFESGNSIQQWPFEPNKPVDPKLYADSRNTWLLDAWADRDPQISFILFYTKAETALAHALSEGIEWQAFVSAWISANKTILRFRHRNRNRTLLFESRAAAYSPADFETACWSIVSPVNNGDCLSLEEHVSRVGPLELGLAKALLKNSHEVFALELELEASSIPLSDSTSPASELVDEIYNDYRQRQTTIQTLKQSLRKADALGQARKNQLHQAETEIDQLKTAVQISKQENELLRLQLRQTQDELDTALLAKQNLECSLQTTESARKKLEDKSETLRKLTEDKINAQESEMKDREIHNELLLLQLQQTQDELEQYSLKHQQLKQRLKEESQQTVVVPTHNDVQETVKNETAKDKKVTENSESSSLIVLSNPFKQKKKNKKRALHKKEQQQIALIRESGLFDENWYLNEYRDVANEGLNPIKHYLRYGPADERNPSPNFNTRFYLKSNPDVKKAGMNPLLHYIRFGHNEGRQAS